LCLTLLYFSSFLGSNYALGVPYVEDKNLEVELVAKNISKPTSMAFLAQDDILVLEKNNGTIQRIINGVLLPEPIMDVSVGGFNKSIETGMLGLDIKQVTNATYYLFVYYTMANTDGGKPVANQLYRYTFVNDPTSGPAHGKIVASKLLLELPIASEPPRFHHHIGGKVLVGPDENVYLPIGDMQRETETQNLKGAPEPNGTGGILRFTLDGDTVGSGILGNSHPLNKYFAYGIRNSFGLGFDPLSGKLWATENGFNCCDEINLVEPGFNSGWKKVMGMAPTSLNFSNLVDFGGKGNYSDPKFVWAEAVAPTAVTFLNSTKLGPEYQFDMFVGDINTGGRIYRFDLNSERTDLLLSGNLSDKVANTDQESISMRFGGQFKGITDLKTGPDGYLYALSYSEGAIYRIVPKLSGN
jgi:glucose/arabinose dehydrogenase